MGCDIHAFLQKKNVDTGKWETVETDLFPGRDYTLFGFLSGVRKDLGDYGSICTPGLPEDFEVDTTSGVVEHKGVWVGEHSFGYVDLETFCNAPLPNTRFGDNYLVEETPQGYSVSFVDPTSADEYYHIRCLRTAFLMMYGEHYDNSLYQITTSVRLYRIIVGYDS